MRKRLFPILLLCLMLAGCTSEAKVESVPAEYEIHGTIPVDYVADMEWIRRYEATDIAVLKERAATEEKECDVLFFGSSSIRRWVSLHEDMAPLRVVNRGYGGATLRDLHYNYATVMDTYKPKAFVLYCDNDIKSSKKAKNLHVGELFDHYRLLLQRLNKDYPNVPLYGLAIKYSEHRAAMRPQQELFNALMADYAAHTPNFTFIDINTVLLNKDGSVNSALFVDDKLHINAEGYALWTALLKPLLMQYQTTE